MLRISRGTLSPALNTPLARNWRPLAALTAGLVVGVFVGFSLVGSRTATSAQPEPAAVNPPVVGDTTDAVGIPYQGTGPAAEIIRGSYRDEPAAPKAPVVPDKTAGTGIPYQGTGPAADIIRGGTAGTTERIAIPYQGTGIPYQGTGPAAEIIRGSYRDEPAAPPAPVVPDKTAGTGIPYQGTGPAADIIRSGSDTTGR